MTRAVRNSWVGALLLTLAACETTHHSTSAAGAAGLPEPDASQGGQPSAAGGEVGATFAGTAGAPGAAGLEDTGGSAGAAGSAGAGEPACDAASVSDTLARARTTVN